MFKLKLGAKGELVIPKKIRDSLGFQSNREVILIMKADRIELSPAKGRSILEKWKKYAVEKGVDVKKEVIYGDKLYEEVFGK